MQNDIEIKYKKRFLIIIGLSLLYYPLGLFYEQFKVHLISDDFIKFVRLKELDIFTNSFFKLGVDLHISSSILLLITGVLIFILSNYKKLRKLHEGLEYFYFLLLFLFAIPGALLLAPFSFGSLLSISFFYLMAILWLFTGFQALRAKVKKNIEKHKKWMIFNFSLALSAPIQKWFYYITDFHLVNLGFYHPIIFYDCIIILSFVVPVVVAWIINEKKINISDIKLKRIFLIITLLIFVYGPLKSFISTSKTHSFSSSLISFITKKELDIITNSFFRWGVDIHIFSSVALLFTGVLIFILVSFNKIGRLHKFLGYFYFFMLFPFAVPGAVLLAPFSFGSSFNIGLFYFIALLWFLTGIKALRAITQKNIEEHKKWIIINFSISLSAPLQRYLIKILEKNKDYFGMEENFSYDLATSISFILPIVISLYIVNRKKKSRMSLRVADT